MEVISASAIVPEVNLKRHASLTQWDTYTVQIDVSDTGDLIGYQTYTVFL